MYVSSSDSAEAKIVRGVARRGNVVDLIHIGPVSFKGCLVGFA
jgi:hypothetical protein